MKKFWIQIVTLLIITGVALYLTFNSSLGLDFTSLGGNSNPASTQIKINDILINVEIADNADKRAQGLSGRTSLASDSGMLFEFDKVGTYQFWMKDMLFPLDFIWIRGETIVDLLPNVPNPPPNQSLSTLPVYQSTQPIDKVLEVNSGYITSHNIKVGDQAIIIQNQ